MDEIRCSSLPRVLACPASLQEPETAIEEEYSGRDIGTAVHEILADYVRGGACDWEEVAESYGLSRNQVIPLAHIGRRMWENVRDGLKVLAVEDKLKSAISPRIDITGHADIIAEDEPQLVVWDWKTGSQSSNYLPQTKAYAQLASDEWPEALEHPIKCVTAWVRDQVLDVHEVTGEDLIEFRQSIVASWADRESYHPSDDACKYCPRRYECPARQKLVRHNAAALAEIEPGDLPATQLAQLKPKADMLKRALKQYNTALKDAVKENGPLPTGDGREVYLQERSRSKIVTSTALPVLITHFGNIDAVMPALKLSKGKLLDAVGDRAEQGKKGKTKQKVMELLEEAGAVEESSYTRLSVRSEE